MGGRRVEEGRRSSSDERIDGDEKRVERRRKRGREQGKEDVKTHLEASLTSS